MIDELFRSKLEFMELLFEFPQGLTSTQIADEHFYDMDQKAISMALKRLVYQNSAWRIRTPGVAFGYTYFLNEYGVKKMYFLQERVELEEDFEDGMSDSEKIDYLEDDILRLERKQKEL